jgi:hypothetical protein
VPVFSNKWTLFLLAILGGVLIWNHNREPDHTPTPESQRPELRVAPSPPPALVETTTPGTAEIPVPSTLPAAAMPAADMPASAMTSPAPARVLPGSVTETPAEAEDITEDLNAVDSAIRNYQAVHGENPIGSNAEITTALLKNNPKQIRLEIPEGSQVNAEGEMCDRWGTPYFFHQVSATEMEIRSAGPDRIMWTGDDSQM